MITVSKNRKEKNKTSVVYDIQLDGTVVNALGMNVAHNTDGFNFAFPKEFRYTKDNPYVSNGAGRNSENGKEYVNEEADVAEFEDLYFNKAWNGGVNKMGLGIDEIVNSTINLRRKNYLDLMPNGSIKKVGNTVKSRKLAGYLKKFIEKACGQLLNNQGYEFINDYYAYIEKIYNYQIPIKDIATKGSIKKTLEDYKKDCNTLTKAGSKKSRQVWYELAIKENLKVNIADTLYYVNTGSKKGESDVKRITHQFVRIDGKEEELTAKTMRLILAPLCEKKGIAYKDTKTKERKEMVKPYIVREEDEIIINSKLVPQEILDKEEDVFCSEIEGMEYNVEKYIDQFNSRIKSFLVCFSPEIRNQILVTDPKDRKFYTKEQAMLVSGYPERETDQDTYEALMTPETKEVAYWTRIGKTPPFIDECEIDWGNLVKKYNEEQELHNTEEYKRLDELYLEALDNITDEEVEKFASEAVIPAKLEDLCGIDENIKFYFKELGKGWHPSTGGNVVDDIIREDFKVDVSY